MQKKLYVKVQGRVMGPVDAGRVLAMMERGRLSADATVSDDKVNWISVDEFLSLVGQKDSEVTASLAEEPQQNPVVLYSSSRADSGQGASYDAPPTGDQQEYNQGTLYGMQPMGGPQSQGVSYGNTVMGAQPQSAWMSPYYSGGMEGLANAKICPNCGEPIAVQATVCHHCGTHFRFCPRCGASIARPEQLVCTQCGCALDKPDATSSHGTSDIGGLGERFVAFLIDGALLFLFKCIIWIVIAVIGVAISFIGGTMGAIAVDDSLVANIISFGGSIGSIVLNVVVNMLVGFIYHGFFLSKRGATPGKQIVHLKVLYAGDYCSFMRGGCRYLSYSLSGLFCGIGYIMVFFNQEYMALHDYLCDTLVVKDK